MIAIWILLGAALTWHITKDARRNKNLTYTELVVTFVLATLFVAYMIGTQAWLTR